MEKRIFAAVLISIGFLWLWAAVAPKLFPDLMKKPVAGDGRDDVDDRDDYDRDDAAAARDREHHHAPTTAPVETPAPLRRRHADRRDRADDHDDRDRRTSSREVLQPRRRAGLVSTHALQSEPSDKNDQTPSSWSKSASRAAPTFPFAIEASDANFTRRANSALYAVDEFDDERRARHRVPLVRRRARGHEDLPLQRRVPLQLRRIASRRRCRTASPSVPESARSGRTKRTTSSSSPATASCSATTASRSSTARRPTR